MIIINVKKLATGEQTDDDIAFGDRVEKQVIREFLMELIGHYRGEAEGWAASMEQPSEPWDKLVTTFGNWEGQPGEWPTPDGHIIDIRVEG